MDFTISVREKRHFYTEKPTRIALFTQKDPAPGKAGISCSKFHQESVPVVSENRLKLLLRRLLRDAVPCGIVLQLIAPDLPDAEIL